MTRHERITRRLRGLGFEPDGERRWVRRDHPADRKWCCHRRYDWHTGQFIVEYDGDGRFTLIEWHTNYYPPRRGPQRPEKFVIGKGLTLTETVAAIGESLSRQRTSGRLPGWWHLPKGKTA